MDEEEDWDAPAKSTPKPVEQQTTTPTAQQTLKITDGYKYSYEALSSPANIDDWIEPPSYGRSSYGGRPSNGYSQNSFRDNNRPFRNDRNDRNNLNKRFDSIKRGDSFSSNSPKTFGAPKPNRFHNRPLPNVAPEDWDAPDDSANQMNGSWNAAINTPVNTVVEDWDAPAGAPSQTPRSVDIPIFNPNNSLQSIPTSNVIEEEDWDAPAGVSTKSDKPSPELPLFNPNTSINTSMHSVERSQPTHTPEPMISASNAEIEEDWDEPSGVTSKNKGTPEVVIPTYRPDNSNSTLRTLTQSTNDESWDDDPPGQSGNGLSSEIPMYNSSNSSRKPYYNNQVNQRYESDVHSSSFPHSKGFDSNERFGREPFNRHSRGNRYNPYDRGGRGRGGRGNRDGRDGRDGREGRDGSYQSFNSRDSSRNRRDRDRDRDRSFQSSSFSRSKNSDRSSYQPPPTVNTTLVEAEEDWDSPTGFAQKSAEKSAPPPPPEVPPIVTQKVVEDEESWD